MRKNYFYNLVLTGSNLLIPLLSFPYAARVLGPQGIGQAQFVFLLGQYLALIAALGIPIYGAREVAKVRTHPPALAGLLRALLLINGFTGLVLFGVWLGCLFWIPALTPFRNLYLTSGLLVLLSFISVEWIYTGLEAFRKLAFRSVAIKLASLLGLFIWVRTAEDLNRYLMLQVGALLAYNLLNFRGILRYLRAGDVHLPAIRTHIRPLLLIFGTTLASTLYTTFDSILLGFLAPDQAVGYYTAATKIAKIGLPLVMAYGAILLPAITVSLRDESAVDLQRHLQNSYAYIVGLGVPLSVALFAFATPLINLFSGTAFQPAVRTLRLLAPMPALVGLGYFWGYQVALPLGREKVLLTAAVLGMVVSLVGNFLLVPFLQQDGAAVAGIAAELVVTWAYYRGVRNELQVAGSSRRLLEAIGAALPFLGVLLLPQVFWTTHPLGWLIGLGGAGALLYGLLQWRLFRNPAFQTALSRFTVPKRLVS